MMICFDYRRTLEELDNSHLVPRAIDNAPFDGNFPAMLQQFPNLRRLDLGFSVPLVMAHILLSCPNLQSLNIYICILRGPRNALVAIPPNDNEVNQRLQAQIIPLRILRIQSQIVTQEICRFIHQHLRLLNQLSIQDGVSLMRDFINSLDVIIGNNSNIAGLSLDNIPGDIFRVLERIHLCFPNLTHLTIHRYPIRLFNVQQTNLQILSIDIYNSIDNNDIVVLRINTTQNPNLVYQHIRDQLQFEINPDPTFGAEEILIRAASITALHVYSSATEFAQRIDIY